MLVEQIQIYVGGSTIKHQIIIIIINIINTRIVIQMLKLMVGNVDTGINIKPQ